MGDVINICEPDTDSFEYIKEGKKLVGIGTKNQCIKIINMETDLIRVESDPFIHMNRDTLVEFLWAAAIFLDSEERYKPEGEIVGLNYD